MGGHHEQRRYPTKTLAKSGVLNFIPDTLRHGLTLSVDGSKVPTRQVYPALIHAPRSRGEASAYEGQEEQTSEPNAEGAIAANGGACVDMRGAGRGGLDRRRHARGGRRFALASIAAGALMPLPIGDVADSQEGRVAGSMRA